MHRRKLPVKICLKPLELVIFWKTKTIHDADLQEILEKDNNKMATLT